jgi:hypothetical protein
VEPRIAKYSRRMFPRLIPSFKKLMLRMKPLIWERNVLSSEMVEFLSWRRITSVYRMKRKLELKVG